MWLRPIFIVLVFALLFKGLYGYQQTSPIGIDVSEHQEKINWVDVKYDNIQFALIRCGVTHYDSGRREQDLRFEQNFGACGRLDIDRGVYYYSQATTRAEAVEEANLVLSWLQGRPCQLPVYIDVEDTGSGGKGRADGLSKVERTEVVKAFCKTIEEGGYEAGVYSNAWFLIHNLNPSELTRYSIWLAAYKSTLPDYIFFGYDIWQYSEEGQVKGIEKPVDLNRYSALKAAKGH